MIPEGLFEIKRRKIRLISVSVYFIQVTKNVFMVLVLVAYNNPVTGKQAKNTVL